MENRLTEHLSKDQLLSGRSTLLLNVKYLSVGEIDLKKVLQSDLFSYLRCALLSRYGVALRLVPHKPRSTVDLLDSSKSWCGRLANDDLPCACSELQAHVGNSVGGSHFVCRLKKSKLAGFFPQNFNVRSGLQPSPARISDWLDDLAEKVNEKLK